jgi:membrane-associated protein
MEGLAVVSAPHIFALLATYAYATLFPLSVVEGPVVTIAAGFLASHGYVNAFLVYVVVVAGDATSDLVWYAAGRWSRVGLDFGWGRRLGITAERLRRIEKHFERHSGMTLVLGKLTQGVGVLVLIGAGMTRMRPARFLLYNLMATLPKSLALLLFGYYFGKAYGQAGAVLDYAALVTVAAVMVSAIVCLIPRHFSRQFR